MKRSRTKSRYRLRMSCLPAPSVRPYPLSGSSQGTADGAVTDPDIPLNKRMGKRSGSGEKSSDGYRTIAFSRLSEEEIIPPLLPILQQPLNIVRDCNPRYFEKSVCRSAIPQYEEPRGRTRRLLRNDEKTFE